MRSVYWLMFAAWVGCGTEKEDGASGGDTAIDGDTDNASDVDTDTAADADPESDCTDFEMNLLEAETLLPAVVRVFFRLTNCDGEAVPGLTEADFTVLEDGDSISIFESSQQIVPTVAGYQLSTLLLLDMSGSMVAAGLVDDLQAATRTFIDRIGTEHEIAIYTFDGREVLSLLVDFTQDATVLNDGIASLTDYEVVDTSTNLNVAVLSGIEVLDGESIAHAGKLFGGTMAVFTDGKDQAGRVTDSVAVTAASDTDHAVYTIGLGGEIDESHLTDVGTSGAVFAEDVDALSTAFDEVAERILNQANSLFILAYCSPKRAGVHDLALKLNGASVRIENTFDATGFEGGCEPEHFVSSAVEDPPTHPDPSDGFVLIPIGRFDMGCTPAQEPFGCSETELPVNLVTFTGAFYMGTTEVTQGEFGALMGYNPSYVLSCGSDCPVDNLTWHESAAYANALSVAEGLDACYGCAGSGSTVTCLPLSESDPYGCGGYRLPTEAEWEYAARAGTDLVYSGSDLVYEVAWTSLTSDGTPHPVGSLAANGWGLYDMSGNVSEWTGDLWGEETYAGGDRVDPVGAVESFYRMHRGGSHNSVYVRVAIRSFSIPAIRSSGLGFRLVRTSP